MFAVNSAHRLVFVAFGSCFLWSASVKGELITVRLEGTVTSVSGALIPTGSPREGSQFAAIYTLDTGSMDTAMSEHLGVYVTAAPEGFTTAIVDGWSWEATEEAPVAVAVLNGNEDAHEVGNSRMSTSDVMTIDDGGEYWLFGWRLHGSPDILQDTNLVVDPLTLAPWHSNYWSISFWGSPPAPLYELAGEVTALRLVDPDDLPAGDTNGDSVVNIEDLNDVRNHFGSEGRTGIVIGDASPFDGVVDIADLNLVRNSSYASASPVPEPQSSMQFAIALTKVAVSLLRAKATSFTS